MCIMYMYMNTQTAAVRRDLNPRLMHSRCAALPNELLRQFRYIAHVQCIYTYTCTCTLCTSLALRTNFSPRSRSFFPPPCVYCIAHCMSMFNYNIHVHVHYTCTCTLYSYIIHVLLHVQYTCTCRYIHVHVLTFVETKNLLKAVLICSCVFPFNSVDTRIYTYIQYM